jgi:four helix bundle protein
MRDFKKLDVWKIARELNKLIYDASGDFPKNEIYGLTSQIRRASVSISSNIAEGCGRRTGKDFVSFLHNAMGSLKEVESQVFLAEDLGYFADGDFDRLNNKVVGLGIKLSSFIEYIRRSELG